MQLRWFQCLCACTGTIPSMENAAGLTTLSLEDNHFTGTIPADLMAFPQLQSIVLYNNSLTGSAAALQSSR